jgi:mono/diheme cytochrome c family protein
MRGKWLSFLIGLTVISLLTNCEENTFKQGELLYLNKCASCHMANGEGLQSLIPPLAGFNYLSEDRAQIACIITNGLADTVRYGGRVFVEPMAGIPNLSEAEITNIINYINHAWGNDFGYVKIIDVKEALKDCRE